MQPLLLNTTRFSAEDTAKGAPESRERHSRIPRRIPKEIQTKYSSTLPGDPTPEGLSCPCKYILIRIYIFLILRHQQLVQLVQSNTFLLYDWPDWIKRKGTWKRKRWLQSSSFLLTPTDPAAVTAVLQPPGPWDSCHTEAWTHATYLPATELRPGGM